MIVSYKRIPGFEKYIVTTDGRVIREFKTRTRELKPFIEYGYSLVCLRTTDGRQYKRRVHRLVAEAFLPNPNNLPEVNHKDENKTNNRVDNLEWCDAKYNTNYGTRNQKISHAVSKSVAAIDKITGETLYTFNSITEASIFISGARSGHIGQCCKGIRKTAGGYKWRYAK